MADQAEKLRAAVEYGAGKDRFTGHGRAGCRAITVASGKGGVGKSNMVLNLALLLTKMRYRVVVVDADLGLANLDVLINVAPRYTLADVLSGNCSMQEIIIRGPLGLKIVPGGSGLYELANLDQGRRRYLLDQLKDLESESDILLIDTGAGLSHAVISLITAADDFILLTTPEPTALTDAYGLMKVIAGQRLRQQLFVAVNFVRLIGQGERSFERLKKVAGCYLPCLDLRYLGEIQYDSAVSRAVQDFVPFVLSQPHSPAASALSRIALRLAPGEIRPVSEERVSGGFFNRLKKLLA